MQHQEKTLLLQELPGGWLLMIDLIWNSPLVFNLIVGILSLVIMVKSADMAVYSICRYAKRLGLSDYLVGILVVALAGSMPELVASITGSTLDASGIILGTLFGSNVIGFTFVLGFLAVFGRKMRMEARILQKTKIDIFILMGIPFILIWDGVLSRLDGVVLLIGFFSYIALLWKKEGEIGRIKKDVKVKKIWKDSILFLGALVALLLSSRWLVFASLNISHELGIRPFLIALLVIALGAQMPDIMIGIRSIIRGHSDVGFGDILGSAVTKALLFLGIIAVVRPIRFDPSIIYNSMVFTMASLGLTLIFVREKEIDWKKGLVLLMLFVAFVSVELLIGS
ncbi:hypothetical protein GF351_02735 [Candidatus Woesearchaeota archaeon]|nr:hypothetical protein [Candidatus Woesearchaeota archaeon]